MSDSQNRPDLQSQTSPEAQSKEAERKVSLPTGGCPSCGHVNPPEAQFCEECGEPLGGMICPHCSASVPEGGDICEACGTWLLEGKCPFCLADLTPEDSFCGECGNPAGGIVCPGCGKLSFFDYCPHCHTKLTEQADDYLNALQQIPELREYLEGKQQYADNLSEMADLEREMEEARRAEALKPDQSAADAMAALVNRRKNNRPPNRRPAGPGKPSAPPSPAEQEVISVGTGPSAGLIEERKKKLQALKEKQAALEAKLSAPPVPPLDLKRASSQEIRRYFMATKPPVTKGWLCHAFQCIHQDPMHCTKPTAGGRWI